MYPAGVDFFADTARQFREHRQWKNPAGGAMYPAGGAMYPAACGLVSSRMWFKFDNFDLLLWENMI
jgi:hypothetical protein